MSRISLKERIFNILYKFKYGTVMALVGIIVLFWDALSKAVTDGKTADVINGVVGVQSSHNAGGAWSIMSNATWVLILLSILFIVFLLIGNWFFKQKNYFYAIAMGFVLSGALGNLIDRINFGYVRDFINLEFMDFPIFNLADCAITVGVILLCVYFLILLPYYERKANRQELALESAEKSEVESSENKIETEPTQEQIEIKTPEQKEQENLQDEEVAVTEVVEKPKTAKIGNSKKSTTSKKKTTASRAKKTTDKKILDSTTKTAGKSKTNKNNITSKSKTNKSKLTKAKSSTPKVKKETKDE